MFPYGFLQHLLKENFFALSVSVFPAARVLVIPQTAALYEDNHSELPARMR